MAQEENNEPPPLPLRKFNDNPNQNQNIMDEIDSKSYSLSGKIMLSAIILLFFVVILMLCLHIYARWYLHRARRRQLRRHRRRNQLVFHNDSVTPAAVSCGLDATVLASLPVFSYDPKSQPETAPECAVCLSEFEQGETGRILPKCKHSFHTECIDMWFHSHDTCPLCRAPVERAPEPEIVITVFEPELETGSGLVNDENRTGCSSSGSRKPSLVGVTVEVPPREDGFRDESESSSSFRSPMSRMLSFTRILSRERRGNVSPSSCGGACSSAAECGAERSEREETQ